MRRSIWRGIKWLSLGIAVFSALGAALLVAIHEPALPPATDAANAGKRDVEIASPVIVERKGDRLVWSLNAAKARQLRNGRMLMEGPSLTLYTRGQKGIPIRGLEAEFDPKTKRVVFRKDVVMHYGDWTLKCGRLIYDSLRDEAYVPGTFHAEGPTLSVDGRTMRLHRGSERLWVENGIRIRDRGTLKLELKP